ncbi:hypothetical protein GQ42DRAFT_161122 [Ramicandelaber brevisporus]|nr:hypothetical protein GQ42DRAFT_161122 [Ramicandelaber brevisporus]
MNRQGGGLALRLMASGLTRQIVPLASRAAISRSFTATARCASAATATNTPVYGVNINEQERAYNESLLLHKLRVSLAKGDTIAVWSMVQQLIDHNIQDLLTPSDLGWICRSIQFKDRAAQPYSEIRVRKGQIMTVLKLMEASSTVPTIPVITHILQASAAFQSPSLMYLSWNIAQRFYGPATNGEKGQSTGQITAFMYSTALRGFAALDKEKMVMQIIEEMDRCGIPIASNDSASVMDMYTAKENVEAVERIFNSLRWTTTLDMNALIRAYGRAGQLDKARDVFYRMIYGWHKYYPSLSAPSTGNAKESASATSQPAAASIKIGHETRPNRNTFHSLMRCHSMHGELDWALKFFYMMQAKPYRFKPTPKTLGNLITRKVVDAQPEACIEQIKKLEAVYGYMPQERLMSTLVYALERNASAAAASNNSGSPPPSSPAPQPKTRPVVSESEAFDGGVFESLPDGLIPALQPVRV